MVKQKNFKITIHPTILNKIQKKIKESKRQVSIMKKKKELISLIVPCYNEEESLPLFYEATKKLMKKMELL